MIAPLRGIKNRAYRDVIATALKQGWTVSVTGANHLRLDPPDGGTPIFCAQSPGGGRGERNLRSLLRQHGVDFSHNVSTKGQPHNAKPVPR